MQNNKLNFISKNVSINTIRTLGVVIIIIYLFSYGMHLGYARGMEDGTISGIYASKISYLIEKETMNKSFSVLDIQIPASHSFLDSHWYEFSISKHRESGLGIEQAYNETVNNTRK